MKLLFCSARACLKLGFASTFWLAGCASAPSPSSPAAPESPAPEPEPAAPKLELSATEQAIRSELEQDISALTQGIGKRSVEEPWGLAGAADYVAGRFEALGFSLQRHGYDVGEVVAQNLEVVVSGATLGKQHVVVGSHYDTRAGVEATDNDATAVAVLLTLARRFKDEPVERTLHFIAYALSQAPHAGTDDMGSRRHAKRLMADGVKVTLALSLDNMGHFSLGPNSQRPVNNIFPALPDQGHFVTLLALPGAEAEAARIKDYLVSDEVVPLLLRDLRQVDQTSDASAYQRVGLPAFQLSDLAAWRGELPGASKAGSVDAARLARAVSHVEATLRAALNVKS
jgi:hypothetical protein